MDDKQKKAGSRKIVVLNLANRVFCKVQTAINSSRYAKEMYTHYNIDTGPAELLTVIIGMPNLADPLAPHVKNMHCWSAQLLLDLAGNADTIIESKVLRMMLDLFAAAHGVPDDEH